MAEPDRNSPSTSSSSTNREYSDAAAASSSSNSSSAREEDRNNYPYNHIHVHHDHHFQRSELEQHTGGFSYRGNFVSFDDASNVIRDDTWSCIIVVLTFWFFVSMTLILGVYGPTSIRLGPNASILIQPNPLFVQKVKVQEINKIKPGPELYGFYKSPPLDTVTTWSENLSVPLPADSHKDWIHFLNKGSQVNISYSVKSLSTSVFLVIAQGTEGLAQWLEDPTYPNTTLSWNIIHGSGVIHQDIFTSSSYYVALGNLNSEEVEVQLDLTVRALLYNTTEAYYKCTFTSGMCSLSVLFPNGNAIVLTSPGTDQDTASDDWYVKVSYGPRWLAYVAGIGGMTVLMYVAFNFLNKFQCTREDGTGFQYGDTESARAPLLSSKDDDLSSWGSSYESISNDEEDLEEFLAASSLEGKSLRDGDDGNNTRRLCAICFDAPRDCFFLPCGHCVACFECGTRIAEASGTCPVCRRNMKKVRKIFTV
ncbi:RING/U-box superfamily protein [Melia azedarach]|uniref:RING/U-box superfamily protein n=2 Tax=Melia azedarach TaxID=155640 RepID=A0ACC1WZU5_MELAZ|nr:RING/U-box superfamily protein [Melia azedarach]KAJ4704441.1 RING/U-box superfamily protein [Melia azedarach]